MCTEQDCNGILNKETPISLRTCIAFYPAYPCSDCGKLHWKEEDPVFFGGNKSYLEGIRVAVVQEDGSRQYL